MRAIRAAIYARYSSDSQREKSLEDQVTMCIDYAKKNNFIIDRNQIYTDLETSGSLGNRPGLDTLVQDAHEKLFDVILVDDFSRISRSANQLFTIIHELDFIGISLYPIADNLVTIDEEANQLYETIKGLYLDSLRMSRRQLGQKKRGFSVDAKADKSD